MTKHTGEALRPAKDVLSNFKVDRIITVKEGVGIL